MCIPHVTRRSSDLVLSHVGLWCRKILIMADSLANVIVEWILPTIKGSWSWKKWFLEGMHFFQFETQTTRIMVLLGVLVDQGSHIGWSFRSYHGVVEEGPEPFSLCRATGNNIGGCWVIQVVCTWEDFLGQPLRYVWPSWVVLNRGNLG